MARLFVAACILRFRDALIKPLRPTQNKEIRNAMFVNNNDHNLMQIK